MIEPSNSAWLVYASRGSLYPLCVCLDEQVAMEVALKVAVPECDEESRYDAARRIVRFCPVVSGAREGAA